MKRKPKLGLKKFRIWPLNFGLTQKSGQINKVPEQLYINSENFK